MIIQFLKNIRTRYIFKSGYETFEKSGRTPPSAYAAMRRMFVLTKGKSNDEISETIEKNVGKYEGLSKKGILGDLSDIELQHMVLKMKEDGYFIFDAKLPEEIVDEIYNFALLTPCNHLDVNTDNYSTNKVLFDPEHPISPRYQFDNADIIDSATLQKLIFDPSLLIFAQEYLGVKPILDLMAFWWSVPFNGVGKSAAAQMYHFDLDRIKFMKFFFYITDVSSETGPHCYVRNSHKFLPAEVSRDGRFTDEEIEAVYGKENMVEICGKKGTIMAVDTRGFHKGKELIKGHRLLFQIEFANSMFGQMYPSVEINFKNEEVKEFALKYPYSYRDIFNF